MNVEKGKFESAPEVDAERETDENGCNAMGQEASAMLFKSQVAALEKTIIPNAELEMTVDELENKRDLFIQTEEKVRELSQDDRALEELFELYNITAEIRETQEGLYEITINDYGEIGRLPVGYAYKGGAARYLLQRAFGRRDISLPRDLDILRTKPFESQEEDDKIARQYMPEDFEHGDGVEEFNEDYFFTRDFTVNEVLASKNVVQFTKECLLDTIRGVIRFSDYEWNSGDVKSKLIAKALRFGAEEVAQGRTTELANRDTYEFQSIYPIHIALHLDRALQRGDDTARTYIAFLIEHGQLPEDIDSPVRAVKWVNDHVEYPFVFRYVPEEMRKKEYEFLDPLYEKYGAEFDRYDALPSRVSRGRARAKDKGLRNVDMKFRNHE